ncbi:3'-5' exonuclease [Aquimarina sp. AD10]|uniref:DNA polymerase III subunit epsilon n=1 Tax=Aquimarina aggregata TaxID=1642818 RepID=A0A162YY86_9FLAO|nr:MULTISPECIES: 3'-5' exonuclease [Aquimarina]AXT61341.1 3'-5' exonuclease [Aquimarina sp. AD10]KZS39436.1 DNA polymerase III subunit epsilon [Aquimarina aggregata]RKN01464.1 3'-5' exonuclease [Aquimarina sp. AD10]
MGFWFKKNKEEYPDFWKEYEKLFDRKSKKSTFKDVRFVAFDTETTGFDYDNDRILSIGAVGIKNKSIQVSDQIEVYLEQEIFKESTVEIHGIRKHGSLLKLSEKEALRLFIAYIEDAILIAHHANFDKKMVNKALQRNGLGVLKNKILDTAVLFKKTKHLVYHTNSPVHYSLDELCNDLKISKSDRHTASGDAYITAIAFLKIVSKLFRNKKIELKSLLR